MANSNAHRTAPWEGRVMSTRWALVELESSAAHASEIARLHERWDVVAKVEEAARIIREAVALELRQPAASGAMP